MPAFQSDHHAGTVRIEDAQHAEIVALLTPIAQASLLFIAEYKAARGLQPPRDKPINEQD